jgi:SulP family sulfate permease
MLIALAVVSIAAVLLHLPVDTIGSRFGGIPHTLPSPRMPDISFQRLLQILPTALSFTLLGGVESLLSAKVADSMTGRRHRSNMELVGQGLANVASAIFGGISVTGTIARTATNIRAGGRSPVAGMLHAGFLLFSCWSPRRLRASRRSRLWPACSSPSAGVWPRRPSSTGFSAIGAPRRCCSPRSA